MLNLRKASALAALLAAVAVSACDRGQEGSITNPDQEPVYSAIDSTFASNPNRTFVQLERLGNPLAMEVFVEKREHGFHDTTSPFRDPDHFTDDYQLFLTRYAGRPLAYANAVAGAILGTSAGDRGDKIRVFPNRAAGVTAVTANTPENMTVGWLTQVLAPGQGYGGRKLRGDDTVDKGLGVIFGAALGGPVTAPGLVTDNVDNTNPAPLNTFPYLPGPSTDTPPDQNRPSIIQDAQGDFLASFIGPRNADLDVVRAEVSLNGTNFTFESTLAGAVGTTPGALYVWGINRGAGTARFGELAPGVLFDAVVVLRADGTGTVNDLTTTPVTSTNLPAGSVTVSGNMITARVPANLLPTKGLQPAQYTANHWPRVGTGNNNQISDFAPNNSNAPVRDMR